MGFLANRRWLRELERVLSSLRLQVTVQWSSKATEERAAVVVDLLVKLRDAGKSNEAAGLLDAVREGEWGTFALGRNPAEARKSIERGGWRPAEGRDAKWAELMDRFDRVLSS